MNIKRFAGLVEDTRLWWAVLVMATVSALFHLTQGSWWVLVDVFDVGVAVLFLRYEYGKRRRARRELEERLMASFRTSCEVDASATYSGYYRPQRPITYKRPRTDEGR